MRRSCEKRRGGFCHFLSLPGAFGATRSAFGAGATKDLGEGRVEAGEIERFEIAGRRDLDQRRADAAQLVMAHGGGVARDLPEMALDLERAEGGHAPRDA